MDRKIISAMMIILIIFGAIYVLGTQLWVDIPNETVNETNVTRDNNRTIQKNNISTNETSQVNISKNKAMRSAEEAGLDLGPPEAQPKAVDATLLRWRRDYYCGGRYCPKHPNHPNHRPHRTWAWNVTLRYPEGVLPDREIYGNLWVDAQTGEVICFLCDQ